METRELNCIICPKGCLIRISLEDGRISQIIGNTCRRGADYARGEVLHPSRIVTGTVRVNGASAPVVSVKTKTNVPKEKIAEIAAVLKQTSVRAPLAIGDVVIADVCGTGVDIVATKAV